MIKIDFEFDSPYGKYADAIVLLDGQTMSDAEIEAMKQDRYDKWLANITSPPVTDEMIEE
jgi:hypothetical protein